MRQKKVRRLPVLNHDGRPVGLVSLSDIARRADEEYARGTANRYVTDARSPAWRLTFPNGTAVKAHHLCRGD
jgi:CBS domain-containing protein